MQVASSVREFISKLPGKSRIPDFKIFLGGNAPGPPRWLLSLPPNLKRFKTVQVTLIVYMFHILFGKTVNWDSFNTFTQDNASWFNDDVWRNSSHT